MKTPKVITAFCADQEYTEAEAAEYIQEQLKFYPQIQQPGMDSVGWVSYKLNCTRRQAEIVIRWARAQKREAKMPTLGKNIP